MKITELSKPKTSKLLNENAARRFGTKLHIETFTLEQLTSARRILASKLNHLQSSTPYDKLTENAGYQTNRALLDVINQALIERKMNEPEEKKKEKYVKGMKKVKGDFEKRYPGKGEEVMYATATKMAKKESVEEAMYILRNALTEQVLSEGEEEKAALIMTSRDIVDKITGFLEDVAIMKSEQLLELQDSIRDELGSEISGQFSNKVKPALEDIYNSLERNRQLLAQAVAIITGEESPTMGAEGAPELAPNEIPQEGAPEMGPGPDQFGAASVATGGTEPTGRMKRESIQRTKKKL